MTTCTIASIRSASPYSQSHRSCFPSGDPPASLRARLSSVAFNHGSAGYVLGSLMLSTMAGLMPANRGAFERPCVPRYGRG